MKKSFKVGLGVGVALGLLYWFNSRNGVKVYAAGRVSEAPFLGTGGLPK